MRNSKWPFSKWPFFEVAFPSGLFLATQKKFPKKNLRYLKLNNAMNYPKLNNAKLFSL